MAWLALGSAWAGAPTSRPWPRLDVPVDCPMGTVCVVQTYVDHAPGPLARDHTCGPLATDGHRGIDIRVPGRRHMTAGVAVVAAAPGLVRTALDGAPDRPSRATLDGDAAGNTVVLDHGGGWVTQYSHLRRGSVAVRPGQRVAAGARLGLIGLSGRTDFPHLHFAVRHGGAALDPFTGRAPEQGCGLAGATPLWSAAARRALAYRAGGLLAAGFATARPT
ncbi:MAG: M23 family metallopeptidase, partial [Kiloniellaceae bacterium]